ncbi:MAG: lipopolysaccharide biosynthesis protein [Muribaculaceae bacterium]|nr:lipopolysaccharide biosynthesis protein [Muribaculaceae bacterium]
MSGDSQLKQRTAKGLLWGGIGNGTMQVLNLVFGIFLARMLTPADYGVVGALTIFSAIAGILSESGFILAIVNRQKVTDEDYNAVFWFSLFMSIAIYTILWFSAPLIARFYNQPEMIDLSRFIFIGFVVSALAASPTAYFFRNLQVKIRSSVQIIALLLSGLIGIYCAYIGLGYWAIAVQTVTYTSTNSLLLWIRCPWRPKLSINFSPLRDMLPFSIKQLVVSFFTQINNNIFAMLLGRFYNMRTTGFYTQGYKWTAMGYSTLNGMLNGVGQPVLRQTVDDSERMQRVFVKLLRFTCLVSFPAMFGLAIVAREFIVLTVSDIWLPSVEVIKILCISGAFIPLATLYGNLFNSSGHPGTYMWNTISLGIVQLICLCCTASLGLKTMLIFYVTINIAWLGIWQYNAYRLTGIKTLRVLGAIIPYLIITLAVMAVTMIATASINNLVISLIAKILLAVLLYALSIKLFIPQDFKEVIDYFRKKHQNDIIE